MSVICSGMRYIIVILISLFIYAELPAQQDALMQGKRGHKRVWRKWHRKANKGDTPFNPYLKKKDKDKVSSRLARGQKKEIRKQRREYRKQIKRGKKKISE
jgi:type III secretory pathway component EscR